MKKYLIVADDFTGSNDTGVQLTKRKIPVQVKFTALNSYNDTSLVIDSESRNIPGQEAKEKVFKLLSNIPLQKYDYLIKKVDSTLRGNIIEELQALDSLYHPDLIIFNSALPSLKRTVKSGILLVNGIRALNTDLKNDPIKPLKEDNLSKILEKAFPNEESKLITVKDLKENTAFQNNNCRLFVSDADTDSDMQLLVHKVTKILKTRKVLWVGSAGIMDAILSENYPTLPALGLVGSVSEVTRQQVKFAEQNDTTIIKVPIGEVYNNEDYSLYVDKAIKSLNMNKNTIIASSASYNFLELKKTQDLLKEKGLKLDEINTVVQSVLGGICRKVLNRVNISGLFITGGDTSKGFFDGIDASGVNIIEEISTGVPLMEITGGPLDSLTIVTKAGAFGSDNLITYAFKKIREQGILNNNKQCIAKQSDKITQK